MAFPIKGLRIADSCGTAAGESHRFFSKNDLFQELGFVEVLLWAMGAILSYNTIADITVSGALAHRRKFCHRE